MAAVLIVYHRSVDGIVSDGLTVFLRLFLGQQARVQIARTTNLGRWSSLIGITTFSTGSPTSSAFVSVRLIMEVCLRVISPLYSNVSNGCMASPRSQT